jgi:hypothetical protein
MRDLDIQIKRYSALPCSLEVFTINGIKAEEEDFGKGYDEDYGAAGHDWSCGNRVFKAKFPTDEILRKYNLTANEYRTVCNKLEEMLTIGCCGWCE